MSKPESIVAFATVAPGHQGGATVRQLLSAGVQVYALARDPSSKAAIDLHAQGARLFLGDVDNIQSLKTAITGASAVLLNVLPSARATSREVTHAKNAIDAARTSSTVTTITSKAQIESMVKNLGIKYWTILRLAFLMNNYHRPTAPYMFPELAEKQIFLLPTRRGEVNRLASNNPRLHAQLWANEVGYPFDFEKPKKYPIKLTTFSQYLEKHQDEVLQTFG